MKQKTTDAAFALLQPWLTNLRRVHPPGINDPVQHDVDDVVARVLWFDGGDVFYFEDPAFHARLCEGLSLLALLARVDIQAYKKTVLQVWSSYRYEKLPAWMETSLPDHFEVGLSLPELPSKSAARFHRHNQSMEPPSDEYYCLRADWERGLKEDDQDDDNYTNIRVRLEQIGSETSEDTTASLRRALALVVDGDCFSDDSSQEEYRLFTMEDNKRPCFKVSHVDFFGTINLWVPVEGVKLLQQLAQRGIRISHLPPLDTEVEPDETPSFTQALRQLVSLDGDSVPGVGSITFNDQFAPRSIPALATATKHSSMVHAVDINIGNGNEGGSIAHTLAWSWIAYALFSAHANHKINKLSMNLGALRREEVRAIREILAASDPLSALFGRTQPLASESTPRRIVSSQFMLYFENGEPKIPFDAKHELSVRVVQSPQSANCPWWSVILPGHGEAWVHADSVISTSVSVPAFPTIEITDIGDRSIGPIAELIDLVGQCTTSIDLVEIVESSIDDADEIAVNEFDGLCERVLASCPKLVRLELGLSRLNDLKIFIVAAEQGHCRLHYLKVFIVRVDGGAEHLRAFLHALCDSNHPFTQHLKSLDLRLKVQTSKASVVIDPVLRMLRENRVLVRVRVATFSVGPLLPKFQSAFDAFKNDAVFIRTGPLGLREKLSFLSVVDQKSNVEGDAMGKLDVSVLATVLQFAAEGQRRDLRLECSE